MLPLAYGEIFKTPEDHQPPEDSELADNTEYPNLNSRDYAKRPLNHLIRMHSAWESIAMNEEGHCIIATNKLSGREWKGTLWGFENVDDELGELTPERSCFKLQCLSLISKVQFASKNFFLVALKSGKVQVWSTRSEVRNSVNPYCLFMIGEKSEHLTPILCMDVMKCDSNTAITASKDGTLKLWDMGGADIFSSHTFRFAHIDAITGVDSDHKDASIFATCSLDKSALLWDVRLTRPATAISENHTVRFKTLSWASPTQESSENLIYLGDESGFVHTVDLRLPKRFLESREYFDRPIRKILPNNQNLAVLCDANIVKIFDTKEEKIIYQCDKAENFVRDGVWQNSTKLLTVGFDGKILAHNIN